MTTTDHRVFWMVWPADPEACSAPAFDTREEAESFARLHGGTVEPVTRYSKECDWLTTIGKLNVSLAKAKP